MGLFDKSSQPSKKEKEQLQRIKDALLWKKAEWRMEQGYLPEYEDDRGAGKLGAVYCEKCQGYYLPHVH